MRVALGPLEPILALNVEKEVRKDALAIRHAGEVPELLRQAQEIDREFLAQLGRFPLLRIEIRYEDIEPIRRRRMERLLDAAAAILKPPWRGIRPAVRACYARADFEAVLREHLRLYGIEVQALNRSVRLPALLAPLRDRLAQRLREIMEQEASALAHEVARLLYKASH